MNILKASDLIEKSEYQKLYYHLNFNEIWLSLFSGINQYRFFNISFPDINHIKFAPKQDYFHLNNISNLSRYLTEESQTILLDMNEVKTFSIKHKKKILCYLHLDWILSLQFLKDSDQENPSILEYLQFETGNDAILKKIRHINGTSSNRSNIYTLNQDSVIINFLNPLESENINKLSKNNYSLILKNPLISLLEISKGFDNNKLKDCLKWINKLCNKINKTNDISSNIKFSLKIRKIKRTNKKGMYIANQNTIIVDPRHMDSFAHELGHWYHTYFNPEIVDNCEAEHFAKNFADTLI